MKTRLQDKRGLTLMELLLAVTITVVILGTIYTVLITGIKTYNSDYSRTLGQQNLRIAMIKVTKQVRNAASGTVSITGAKVLTVSSKNFSVTSGNLLYGSAVFSSNISAISADYVAGTSSKVIQVDLTSADGNTLSTQIRVN